MMYTQLMLYEVLTIVISEKSISRQINPKNDFRLFLLVPEVLTRKCYPFSNKAKIRKILG